MERFTNAGDDCGVLMRAGDTALIHRTNCTCQPYVVPLLHREGDSDWWHGKYFSKYEDALEYYHRVAVKST